MPIHRRPPLSLLLAALALASVTRAAHAVDNLDHLTLDPYLTNAGKKPVLLEFFAPWCSHCRLFEAEYKQVAMTLDGEAHVARIDGSAHQILTSRFRVQGFPSFFLVLDSKVTAYTGARSHDGLVSFVRTAGEAGGEPMAGGSQLGGGPFSPYWQAVRAVFAAVDSLRVAAERYKDRPLMLFAVAFGTAMLVVVFFALVIYFITKPNLPPPSQSPPRPGAAAAEAQRPHAE